MELLLIRHGLTRANLERRFCGRTDWPLLPESLLDLDQLAHSGALPTVEVVCHTGLLRTIQTAERLFPGVPTQGMPSLAEFDFGDFEALTHDDLQGDPAYVRWLAEYETMACPNGESQRDFQDRVRWGFRDLTMDWT
ncbi:MAG: histidine phosphatase family protein, partial [Clostridia bacterium]|nr:histidine phosphatase family protein [Clostridia bacterium]